MRRLGRGFLRSFFTWRNAHNAGKQSALSRLAARGNEKSAWNREWLRKYFEHRQRTSFRPGGPKGGPHQQAVGALLIGFWQTSCQHADATDLVQ